MLLPLLLLLLPLLSTVHSSDSQSYHRPACLPPRPVSRTSACPRCCVVVYPVASQRRASSIDSQFQHR
jgi:hypothetical protein